MCSTSKKLNKAYTNLRKLIDQKKKNRDFAVLADQKLRYETRLTTKINIKYNKLNL